jgi:hypothetical protein
VGGEWVGENVGDFWDSIGNVNEVNTQLKKRKKKRKKRLFANCISRTNIINEK